MARKATRTTTTPKPAAIIRSGDIRKRFPFEPTLRRDYVAPNSTRRDSHLGTVAPNRAPNATRAAPRPPSGLLLVVNYLLIVLAAAVQTASSCAPVPPEQPTAPMILPPSINGMPPRE